MHRISYVLKKGIGLESVYVIIDQSNQVPTLVLQNVKRVLGAVHF